MMIKSDLIANSVNESGQRFCTYVLTYPRFIHAEVMTHRVFSRNASSSRAIPLKKSLKNVFDNPVVPRFWGKNERGMQASKSLTKGKEFLAKLLWKASVYTNLLYAKLFDILDLHKQLSNRIIEPYSHITTILSGTEFTNFFYLRVNKNAQPEFQELAFQMLCQYIDREPNLIRVGDWHLPFADKYIAEDLSTDNLLKIATARCARVSYLNFEGDIDHEKDYALHDRLAKEGHYSPFEHCAVATATGSWKQYRKFIQNENHLLSFNQLMQLRSEYVRQKT